MKKFRFGTIHADYIDFEGALDAVVELAKAGKGGFVVTPNVDHVVMSEKNEALRAAYADASLSLVDGMPLVWMSKAAGFPLPEKISGSDLVRPLLRRAADAGLGVYLLGAAPGVGAAAAEILKAEMPGLRIVGVESPPLGFEKDPAVEAGILARMEAAAPDLVLMALGCPKQELLMHRWYARGAKPVMLGIGATLDFIAGKVKRAPRWMSAAGLEWVFRITQDPLRLAKRYLVQDAAIVGVFFRTMRTPKESRVFEA